MAKSAGNQLIPFFFGLHCISGVDLILATTTPLRLGSDLWQSPKSGKLVKSVFSVGGPKLFIA